MARSRLESVIREARSRRRWRAAIGAASLGGAAALLLALLAVVWHRLTQPEWPLLGVVLGLALAGPVVGLLHSLFRRSPDDLAAALELEKFHHLKERLSSALFVSQDVPVEGSSEVVELVRADGEQHADRVDVRRAVPIAIPRSFTAAWGLLLVVGLTWWLLPNFDLFGREEAREEIAREGDRIEKKERRLRERARRMQELAERHQISPETKRLLADLQKQRELPKRSDPRDAARKPLADLEDLKRRAEALTQRPEMQGLEEIVRGMQSIEERMETAEGQRARRALSDGSPQRAAEAMKALAEKLAGSAGEMTAEQQQALARDLEKLAAALGKKMPSLSKELTDALSKLKAGDLSSAAKGLGENAAELERLARLMRERGLLDQISQEIEFTQDELAQLPKEWRSGPPPEICPDCLKGT